MEISIADQIALDDALVAPANRLKIGKCNLRLSTDVTSKGKKLFNTYDVLKLTPFYKAFQVSADVPEIYMQEFWASAYVHNRSIENKNTKKGNAMYYPRFTKLVVNFVMNNDPSIPRRNKKPPTVPKEKKEKKSGKGKQKAKELEPIYSEAVLTEAKQLKMRGAIDKTLFIKKDRRDIMLVQVYVDDIIFGYTKSSMVKDFEELMQKEFKMSSMGELTFFLGLQVKQTSAGIFLSEDKYVKDILNKFDFRTIKPASTPIESHKSLGKDEESEDVDVHLYRSMIGCLMYLTASRPDIMFAVFRYLKHQPKLGLWYPKDSPFHLEAFSDSDYAGDNHDRRSTLGGCQYLGRRLVSWQCKKQIIVAISSTESILEMIGSGDQTLLLCPHSRAASSARDAQGTPTQSAAHSQRTASVQGTASFHVKRLKRQTLSQAKQIFKLKAKLKKLSKFVQPVVKHHAFWVESQHLKQQKRRRKKHKKKVSSVKLGRNKDEGTLSEEHYVQEEDTADPFFDKDAAVTPDLERKSDETEEVNIEEKEASNVKSGETEELDLETTQSTARQGTITPRTLNFEDEAGPSSPLRPIQVMESEEQLKAAEVLVAISRPRGLSIPGPIQTQPQQPTQALVNTIEEEVASIIQADGLQEKKERGFEGIEERNKAKTTLRKPTYIAQERNQKMAYDAIAGLKEDIRISEIVDRMLVWQEVEDENETAITLIHLFILWTTEDGDNS
ncbi:uncharacterized mitochondrial protein-like protein [Tanacetum coccineum]